MNRFLRKNMFLAGFLALAALGVLALLVFSVTQFTQWNKYSSQTAEMKRTVETLRRQRPSAVAGNISRIQNDIDGYGKLNDDLRYRFGHPFRPALEEFAKALGLENVGVLESSFRAFWEKEKLAQRPRELVYRRFSNPDVSKPEGGKPLWKADKWDEAFQVFIKNAQKATIEPLSEGNAEELFLSALGLPRNQNDNPERCMVLIRGIHGRMVDLLGEKNVRLLGVYFNQTGISPVKSEAAFGGGLRIPAAARGAGGVGGGSGNRDAAAGFLSLQGGTTIQVIRNWEIMSDLVSRIANSGVEALESFSYASAAGRGEGRFTVYTYEFTVTGGPGAIRKLFNDLNAAYAENRIYVVRNLSLRGLDDQGQDIIDVASGLLSGKPEESTTLKLENAVGEPGGGIGVGGGGGGADGKMQAAQPTHFVERDVYGEIVLGRSQRCEATIVVDYVVYTENELK